MPRFYSLGICLLLSSFVLQAQEVVFTTQIPVNKMGKQDIIPVRYVIKNTRKIQNFQLASSDDFKIVGAPSKSTNFDMTNDRVSMSVTYTYSFQPKRTGRLNFPTAMALYKGQKIKSNQASIDVVNGSLAKKRPQNRQQDAFSQDPFMDEFMRMSQQMMQQHNQIYGRPNTPSNAPNRQAPPRQYAASDEVNKENLDQYLFIKASVDKKDVHIGEQVTVNYKLYARGVLARMDLTKLPEFPNFWIQEFSLPSRPAPSREVYNGKEYQVWTIRKAALFPNTIGELSLAPAEVEGTATLRTIKRVKRNSPFGNIYDEDNYVNMYQQEDVPVKLKSDIVTINVTDFPEEEKPKEFRGAVGSFTTESKISATEITTDDIAKLTLTIRGNGNIKLIDAPKLNLGDSIVELFDPIEFDTITSRTNDKITGYKTVTYRFSPKGTGLLKVPPITLAYYNAAAERYEIRKTPEYTIRVKPGKEKEGQHILPMDIHDISAEHTKLQKEHNTLLPEQMAYWGAYLLPTLGFLFLLAYKRREEGERKDNVRFKNKRANKVALSRLQQAEHHRQANEPTKFYEETSKAVWLYMSDKLNIPISTLSKEMAGTLLRKREVSQNLIDEIFLITDECEIALYAPEAGDFKMNQIYSDSLKIIGTLEDKLG